MFIFVQFIETTHSHDKWVNKTEEMFYFFLQDWEN